MSRPEATGGYRAQAAGWARPRGSARRSAAELKVMPMNLPLRAIAAVILATGALSHHVVADGQTDVAKVVVELIDGRNGKPMAEHRLIVLTGPWADRPIEVNQVLEARTDGTGRAELTVDRSRLSGFAWPRIGPGFASRCRTRGIV